MAKAEKIYDIAEKLGYEGDTGGNTSDAINACADALGFVGPHARRITDALSDLETVVGGGGGGGGSVGAGVAIFVRKTGVDADLGFIVGDSSMASLNVSTNVDTFVFVPSGIEYLLAYPNDGTDWYEFSDGNVTATVTTNDTETPFTDFAVVDVTMGGQTTKAVKFTPPAPSAGDQVTYAFTIGTQSGGGDDVSI